MARRPAYAALNVTSEQVSIASDYLFPDKRLPHYDGKAQLAALGEQIICNCAALIFSGGLSQEIAMQFLRDIRLHILQGRIDGLDDIEDVESADELLVLQMLGRLPDEIGANYLAERLNMSRSAVDAHLHLLLGRELITRSMRGKKAFFSLSGITSARFRVAPGTPMVHTASRPRAAKRGASFKFSKKGL